MTADHIQKTATGHNAAIWPLFDLRLRTPRLELRPPTDEDLFELARLAARGVHDPNFVPFVDPWSTFPSPQRERALLRRHWRHRADWAPDSWCLSLVVAHDGKIIGCHELDGEKFRPRRVIETTSWIGLEAQGKGFGKEARAAALHLAFRGLGAKLALMGVFAGNEASARMAKGLGYEENGVNIDSAKNGPVDVQAFRMTAQRWRETARNYVPVEIDNLRPCLPLFGQSTSRCRSHEDAAPGRDGLGHDLRMPVSTDTAGTPT